MLRSILMGVIAGMRAMTPLAAVTDAARRGALPPGNGAPRLLGHPLVASGAATLAAAEIWGDKLESAPDRVVPAGMAARILTAGIAGMAVAPREHRILGATVAVAAAVVSSYLTFNARIRAMDRYGRRLTGAIEDAIVTTGALAVANVPQVDHLVGSSSAKQSG